MSDELVGVADGTTDSMSSSDAASVGVRGVSVETSSIDAHLSFKVVKSWFTDVGTNSIAHILAVGTVDFRSTFLSCCVD